MRRSIPTALGLLVPLGGCSADSAAAGPAAVADGAYTLLATSARQTPDAATSLTLAGDQV